MKRKKNTRMKITQPIVLLCALLTTGCSNITPEDIALSGKIYLEIDGLGDRNTRAALDAWDSTAVSIAYAYAPSTVFDRSLTVSVNENSGEHINTGMEYPTTNNEVSFIGYYPVASPNASGIVDYNISNGDVDVMMSNKVSGRLNTRISSPMIFAHKLTRFTFLMVCKAGASYPEPVNGITVVANSAYTNRKLMTYVALDLNTATETFKIPGTVFNGSAEGVPVPQNLGGTVEPLVFDMMIQPDIPLLFKVVTLTDEKQINLTADPGGYWSQITQGSGGTAGTQYTIKLEFSGENILYQGISVTSWNGNNSISGDNSTVWW